MRLLKLEPLEIGKPFKIEFTLANIGDTVAEIATIEATLRIRDIVPVMKNGKLTGYEDFTKTEEITRTDTIDTGESVGISHGFDFLFPKEWGAPDDYWASTRVYIIGNVAYTDDRGVKRKTAFYRVCSENVDRFHFMPFKKAQKRDYEYED